MESSTFLLIVTVVIMFLLYMLPAIVASSRSHRNTAAITMLTMLLGWTLLGWAVAMVWAFTDNTD